MVDADLRKGRLNQVTQLGKHLGLTDVITGECTLQDAIVADPDAENLFVLTAGTTRPNPLEIISSAKLAKALAKLRSTFEYIIIDGSPLMPVSDSLVLGHLVDGVLFVVHSGKTSQDLAKDALKRLAGAAIRPIGVVLQQVDFKRVQSYKYRYAYYDRAYYGYARHAD